MTITQELRGKVSVLGLKGTFMGEPEASLFHAKKFQLLQEDRTSIVLDLSETTMINSSGLGSIISALVSIRDKGGDLRLAGLGTTIHHVIEKVQLDKVFKVFKTVDDAVASFEKQR